MATLFLLKYKMFLRKKYYCYGLHQLIYNRVARNRVNCSLKYFYICQRLSAIEITLHNSKNIDKEYKNRILPSQSLIGSV